MTDSERATAAPSGEPSAFDRLYGWALASNDDVLIDRALAAMAERHAEREAAAAPMAQERVRALREQWSAEAEQIDATLTMLRRASAGGNDSATKLLRGSNRREYRAMVRRDTLLECAAALAAAPAAPDGIAATGLVERLARAMGDMLPGYMMPRPAFGEADDPWVGDHDSAYGGRRPDGSTIKVSDGRTLGEARVQHHINERNQARKLYRLLAAALVARLAATPAESGAGEPYPRHDPTRAELVAAWQLLYPQFADRDPADVNPASVPPLDWSIQPPGPATIPMGTDDPPESPGE